MWVYITHHRCRCYYEQSIWIILYTWILLSGNSWRLCWWLNTIKIYVFYPVQASSCITQDPSETDQDRMTPRRLICVHLSFHVGKEHTSESMGLNRSLLWLYVTMTNRYWLQSLCHCIPNISELCLYILHLLLQPTCQHLPTILAIHAGNDLLPSLCNLIDLLLQQNKHFFHSFALLCRTIYFFSNTMYFRIVKHLFLQRFLRPRMSPLLTFLLIYYSYS